LLVAHKQIAPREEVKQLPVAPKIPPILPLGAAGFDYQLSHAQRIQ
jgi:hypothetical protein